MDFGLKEPYFCQFIAASPSSINISLNPDCIAKETDKLQIADPVYIGIHMRRTDYVEWIKHQFDGEWCSFSERFSFLFLVIFFLSLMNLNPVMVHYIFNKNNISLYHYICYVSKKS